jgi:DhnA family fructose-bisphosphate aldolase class Ia
MKVFMSGGPKAPTDEAFLLQVQGAMDAGATGLAVGRNAWQNANPLQMAAELRKVIHERQRAEKLVPASG